jgi:hypothetical protein
LGRSTRDPARTRSRARTRCDPGRRAARALAPFQPVGGNATSAPASCSCRHVVRRGQAARARIEAFLRAGTFRHGRCVDAARTW